MKIFDQEFKGLSQNEVLKRNPRWENSFCGK